MLCTLFKCYEYLYRQFPLSLRMKQFREARKAFDAFEEHRETLIKISRDILKQSKAAIYALHRNEVSKAKRMLKQAEKDVANCEKLVQKDAQLRTLGALNEGYEEYVEAACYLAYIKDKTLPSFKTLKINVHNYLPGVCDLVGELTRKAMNDVLKEDYDSARQIHAFVNTIYDEFLLFDWRNTPVRRKFDSIKYSLEKLENLLVKLKLKE